MPKRRPAKKRSPAAAVLLAVLCLLLLAVSRYLDSRSEPAASVSAPEAAQADASGLEVHFLDIGQGDSALLFCGDETLLIDGGKVKNNQKLIARLKELEVDHLDAVICSHPDEDHCGGLSAVLASTRTDAFYCSVDSWHTKVFSDVTKSCCRAGYFRHHSAGGRHVRLQRCQCGISGSRRRLRATIPTREASLRACAMAKQAFYSPATWASRRRTIC